MLNLTRQEKLVIEFLVFFLIVGSGIRLYRDRLRPQPTVPKEEIAVFQELVTRLDSNVQQPSKRTEKSIATPKTKPAGKINLNRATKSELMTLPKIGEVTADRIIAYREEHGGFKNIEELKNVKGIGPKTFELIKGEVTVE